MADKYQTLLNGERVLIEGTVTGGSVGEAGDILALGPDGRLDDSVMPVGIVADTLNAPTSETVAAGDYVNIWDDGGTVSVRLADNSNARPADGFVKEAATAPASVNVYFEGPNDNVSGKTLATRQYLGTLGQSIETPLVPATDGGKLHQYLGKSVAATSVNTDIDDHVIL